MRVLFAAALVVVLTTASHAVAQTAPPCPRGSGSGLLTSTALGGGIRDGQGIGAVSLGSTPAEVERAWGAPLNCLPQQQGYSYTYILTDDGGQTSSVLTVVFVDGKTADVGLVAAPHRRMPAPAVLTARGVGLSATADEVRRRYGTPGVGAPGIPGDEFALYAAEGIAFVVAQKEVSGIFVFRPGTMPSALRP
jgi:hypothetical protein